MRRRPSGETNTPEGLGVPVEICPGVWPKFPASGRLTWRNEAGLDVAPAAVTVIGAGETTPSAPAGFWRTTMREPSEKIGVCGTPPIETEFVAGRSGSPEPEIVRSARLPAAPGDTLAILGPTSVS